MAAIGRIFDGRTGFDAGQVQRADVGDVIGRAAARIGGQRDAGGGGRRVEREAERGRVGRVAGDIGLPDLDIVQTFGGDEAGAPRMTAVGRIFDGGASFDTGQVQRARTRCCPNR
ncbi:hypothetical protein [Burkholderia ubonensis]|uniref:hypothetical protein n=1 Tax=Burkholderia ubonensis TaxID=101571 RepID=UPI00159EFDEC|nr:hypothetical protein [Burkholderia ubonensis]